MKFEAAVPKWGPGHAGLRCVVILHFIQMLLRRFYITRKFIQNQVGVFKFNSWPNLSTHFSNAPAKDAQSILKLHTSVFFFALFILLFISFLSGDGKIHELVVAGKRESDIVQLVKECEASQASHLSESMAEAQATK